MKHLLAGILFALAVGSAAAQPPDAGKLDEIIRESLASWQAPGVAVAVVKDGQLLYLRGQGVRLLGSSKPVTADTVFPIASCTKSFTVLAMAMLADEGKLDWDDPVRKHLPAFRLADPLADAQVTLRDLLTHRTGVGRHELLWYHAPWRLEERIRKMAFIKPDKPFRASFAYQSTLFGAAGHAAAHTAGVAWNELVRRRIVEPLGMRRTSFTTDDALRSGDVANPHRKKDGAIEPISWYRISEPDPAGSINSTARDLALFLKLLLSGGVWNGVTLVSPAALSEMHTGQVVIRPDSYLRLMNPESAQVSYGLGWIVQDYRGQQILMHGGSIDGFRAHFTLAPRQQLGIVLLNNLGQTQMNLALSNTLVDLFAGHSYKDWNTYYQRVVALEEKADQRRKQELLSSRHEGTKPSRPLPAYTGDYEDAAYGVVRVAQADGRLILHWSTFAVPLEHFHYDTFLANNGVLIDTPVQFILDTDGEVATLRAFEREFHRKK